MTYYKQEEVYKTTANKVRFNQSEPKLIPCEILSRMGEAVLIKYKDSSGTIYKWTKNENLIEKP